MTENLSPDLLAEALRQSLERELELEKKLKDAEGLRTKIENFANECRGTNGLGWLVNTLDGFLSPAPRDPAQGDERQGM